MCEVTGLLAKIMNLKPVVSIDSEGRDHQEKALSLRRNQKQIVKLLQKRPLEEYVIVRSRAGTGSETGSKSKATGKKASYTEISPIVA